MAAATVTPSRFGSSWTNGGHAPFTAHAPSMAETLPSVDFGFNDLRERMANFTAQFDEFIERGRKRVLQERNAFRMNVTELEDSHYKRRQNIIELESKSSMHADTLAKEAQETEEMHESIRDLQAQKETQQTRRDELKREIESTHMEIKQRKEAQATHQRSLDAQARHNMPELRFWEHCLGVRMEGAGDEKLRVLFSCIDEKDTDRECWFDLDTSSKGTAVGATDPKLDPEDIASALERFKETEELSVFFKAMRSLLIDACKS